MCASMKVEESLNFDLEKKFITWVYILVDATEVYNLRSDAVIGQDEIMVINTQK
jgi:hypothetical protein